MPPQRLNVIEPSDKKTTHIFASGRTSDLQLTDDKSLTLKDPETGELFHNKAGAYTEALLNYIQASGALQRLEKQGEIALLDVCFGLGYNSFVLICEALKNKLKGSIKIDAIDSDQNLVDIIPTVLSSEPLSAIASSFTRDVLSSQHRTFLYLDDLKIEFCLRLTSIGECLPSFTGDFDFVFHDPFSPRRMPELWTVDIFKKYFELLQKKRGAMLTYSSAVAVRGGLSEAGFQIRRTSALGAKTGGTIAFVSDDSAEFFCEELSEEELARLSSNSSVPYRDPEFKMHRESVLTTRREELTRRGGAIINDRTRVLMRLEASKGDGDGGS